MSAESSSCSQTSMGYKYCSGMDNVVMNNADYSVNYLCLGVTVHIQWDFPQKSSRPARCWVPHPLCPDGLCCCLYHPSQTLPPSAAGGAGTQTRVTSTSLSEQIICKTSSKHTSKPLICAAPGATAVTALRWHGAMVVTATLVLTLQEPFSSPTP